MPYVFVGKVGKLTKNWDSCGNEWRSKSKEHALLNVSIALPVSVVTFAFNINQDAMWNLVEKVVSEVRTLVDVQCNFPSEPYRQAYQLVSRLKWPKLAIRMTCSATSAGIPTWMLRWRNNLNLKSRISARERFIAKKCSRSWSRMYRRWIEYISESTMVGFAKAFCNFLWEVFGFLYLFW